MCCIFEFFFFNDTATTEIYTLSLHDALPIFRPHAPHTVALWFPPPWASEHGHRRGSLRPWEWTRDPVGRERSEEHTSELQSRQYLVCRLLLEKKKKT